MAGFHEVQIRFGSLRFILVIFLFLSANNGWAFSLGDRAIGINYGRLGSNLPSFNTAIEKIKSQHIYHVKTFDLDPNLIRSFSNTNISLSLCVPNDQIPSLASHPSGSDLIMKKTILPFIQAIKISSISVGNEVSMDPQIGPLLLPAMKNLYKSLRKFKLHKKIRVSTTHSLAVLAIRFPPSNGIFQESIGNSILKPILKFLNETKSPYFVNLYPYLTFKETDKIPLDFALFMENPHLFYKDPNNGLVYTNLFDCLVDALNAAASQLGFDDLTLVVTETGWPSKGHENDNAASLENAKIFNQRLIQHVMKFPIVGTPLRPARPVMTFIFALFDEDLKEGEPTENHWGVFYANGSVKYDIWSEYFKSRRENEVVRMDNNGGTDKSL